jgi:uncharacterized protein
VTEGSDGGIDAHASAGGNPSKAAGTGRRARSVLPPPPATPPAPNLATTVAPPAGRVADVPLNVQLDAGAAPVDRGAAGFWLLFGALGFLAGQILATLFIVVGAVLAGQLHNLSSIQKLSEPPTWYIVSTLLGLWCGFLGAPWMASRLRGTANLVRDIGLRFRWIDLLGIPIGIGGQLLVGLVYIPISQHVHNFSQRFDAPSQKLTGGSHGLGFAVVAVLTVVAAPFFEEVFFRGLLLRSLARLFGNYRRWVGPALAIVITGVLFGLAHAESLQLIGLALFGVILSFVSYRTGRLGMNMVSHGAFNLVAVIAALHAGSGTLF